MFEFLKYIQPLYYYRLVAKMPHAVLLSKEGLGSISALNEGSYRRNQDAVFMDLAYQALQAGYFPKGGRNEFQNVIITDREDNYRFISRHFGPQKALYVLVLRILSLKNPILEFWAFTQGLDVKVVTSSASEKESFKRIASNERVTVVIPTLNRYDYLKDVLADLEKQTHQNFDVWVCDQSEDFKADFYEGWELDLHVIQQKEKALWRARNRCIEESTGEYLLFFDDDSRVENNWIEDHLRVGRGFISAGVTDTLIGGGLGSKSAHWHLSDVLDTGNVLIHRSVFFSTGPFDENFEKLRMGDGEFGLRCLLNGFPIISNPLASRVHLKGETGGLRQMGAWDVIHSIGLFKPRPIPSSLYLARKHFDNETALIYGLTQLPKALIPYKNKNKGLSRNLPYLLGAIVLSPLLIYTFFLSWIKSTELLNKYQQSRAIRFSENA